MKFLLLFLTVISLIFFFIQKKTKIDSKFLSILSTLLLPLGLVFLNIFDLSQLVSNGISLTNYPGFILLYLCTVPLLLLKTNEVKSLILLNLSIFSFIPASVELALAYFVIVQLLMMFVSGRRVTSYDLIVYFSSGYLMTAGQSELALVGFACLILWSLKTYFGCIREEKLSFFSTNLYILTLRSIFINFLGNEKFSLLMLAIVAFVLIRMTILEVKKANQFLVNLNLFMVYSGAFLAFKLDSLFILSLLVSNILLTISNLEKNIDQFSWCLVSGLLFLSPPIGLGYVLKVELFENASKYGHVYLIISSCIALFLSLKIIFTCISFGLPRIPQFKENGFKLQNSALGSMALLILLSLLFIPIGWSDSMGEVFLSYFNKDIDHTSKLNLGNYLFWAELLIIVVFGIVYSKTPKEFWEKRYLNISYYPNASIVEFPRKKVTQKGVYRLSLIDLIETFGNSRTSSKTLISSVFIVFFFVLFFMGVN